jgi:hypothetical protein
MVMSKEIEWPLGPLTPEELPSGVYLAGYRDWEYSTWHRRPKIRLEFEIIEPSECAKLIVNLYANYTMPQHHHNRRMNPKAKYYRLWRMANGGPPRGRMRPTVFQGWWRVRIEWSMNEEGEPMMPVITELLERVAGGPQ